MTLDEAIKHCEEVAEEQNKLCEQCDRASGYFRSHNEAIRTSDAKKHEKCGQEHIQLVAWLRELKAYKEQEPCTDAISRKAVIDMTGLSEWFDSSDSYNGFVIALSELPSVTPKQKTGKWVDIKKDGNRIYRCRCSECGKNPIEYTYGYEDWWFEELPKFCPDCGTKMENEDI
jgi:hypothetical protein